MRVAYVGVSIVVTAQLQEEMMRRQEAETKLAKVQLQVQQV